MADDCRRNGSDDSHASASKAHKVVWNLAFVEAAGEGASGVSAAVLAVVRPEPRILPAAPACSGD